MIPDFERATKEATKLLAMQKDLLFYAHDIRGIRTNKNIIFDSMQAYCALTHAPLGKFMGYNGLLKDGCTIYDHRNDLYLILYNFPLERGSLIPLTRLNWTLSHELGHIYLGHTTESRVNEIEANHFAAQLLMPDISMVSIVWMFDNVTVEDISNLFWVSKEAARKRLDTVRRHYDFIPGPLSDDIWKRQRDRIFRYFKEKEFAEAK